MYLPFDKSILNNIPYSGHIILKYVVAIPSNIILKILFFLLLPMIILITEGGIYPFLI